VAGSVPRGDRVFGVCGPPELTAFVTSAAIFFSSSAVNSVRAQEVGYMAPWSRFAAPSKPNAVSVLSAPRSLKEPVRGPGGGGMTHGEIVFGVDTHKDIHVGAIVD
jgi:hypothetical protein